MIFENTNHNRQRTDHRDDEDSRCFEEDDVKEVESKRRRRYLELRRRRHIVIRRFVEL